MKIRYTPEALIELDDVLAGIAEHSPQGAGRISNRIEAVVKLLSEHPYSGQPASSKPMRRIVASPYPYIIFYEPGDGEVVIIGIRHAARDPSSMPDTQTRLD
ncbi:type II toxin-antitoxin system RelE/ParE family toxin [Rhizobium sp. LC145]|uniref:type II toxin-antitoxin system RelE/ParE family toxin n=1 Tax=Rhizobium sp. LC145 TaxID=1120688 RepID=UPI000629F468|nr:type II toxin-antitoxin system RelE/ParE family toxin [Rhizobium sp. LC145]KKX33928.1 stabilization protein [Rhizobium sp. LC145]TKT44263.1 type II toxin-antitoxin system RelE/ParE family toxin [Rhizobiaceae bacterium LC148]